MAAANEPTADVETPAAAAEEEDATARAARKRYEGLLTVRAKAVKGKGAWYWAHLEPILVHSADSPGVPKAVKLRCSLCATVFSASNPSRTASEHLKRGTCPNFSSPSSSSAAVPTPISTLPPTPRKRSAGASSSYHVSPLALADPAAPPPALPAPPLVLSGGKEELGALAMLEDSVKRLKSPKASPGPPLPKPQADAALSLLADWLLESLPAVSPSALAHPKFQSFLHQIGLPAFSPRRLALPRLHARHRDARADADARLRDALFFQISSGGWKSPSSPTTSSDHALVSLAVNLPNGTTVFHRAELATGGAPPGYAEEVLWDAVAGLSGGLTQRCIGIVADRFKSTALRSLESQHHWTVNLYCQFQGFHSLIKDFARELPLFQRVTANCSKLANFFNTHSQARSIFHKHQLQELDQARLIRSTAHNGDAARNLAAIFALLEDVMSFVHPLQLAVIDEEYKMLCLEVPAARELAEMIQDMSFWTELEAVCSVVKLVKDMAQEMEAERPLVGQCLPLWDELKTKVKEWCSKYSIEFGPVEEVIEKRFKKNYHPAWAAAFVLDPLYLVKDTSGKYLPPFKFLTPDQEKDVDRLITRLVLREEAHIALMELMKWRSEGLDPLYAQAVQEKQLDPSTGKMRLANPQSSRLVWETCLSDFKSLGKVAARLIFLHATSCGFKGNLPLLRRMWTHGRSSAGMDRAQKMLFVQAHSRLERRDFSSEEEKDAEFLAGGEEDVLNEAFVDAPSVNQVIKLHHIMA
ncbi:uncharacterized protein LOC103708245 [Phoenix dactylifera]|uniref:Uncharacterized protein LOC103708245 n=1 Tax=Phoenix dactylifera TaxID=42345 RepID=A0A8B8ZH01_PHODC|nr:uncharacterized protein LOC103708245 [Phoenix dactylifera]